METNEHRYPRRDIGIANKKNEVFKTVKSILLLYRITDLVLKTDGRRNALILLIGEKVKFVYNAEIVPTMLNETAPPIVALRKMETRNAIG